MFRRSSRGLVLGVSVFWALAVLAAGRQAPADIYKRHVEAIGGAEAFRAVKSMHARGTMSISLQGLTGDLEVFAARPNKLLTRATVAGIGKFEEGFDGKVGWSIDPISGPSISTGRALKERTDEAWFDATLHDSDYVRQSSVVSQEEFDGRQAIRVKVTLVSGSEETEFFDVKTGLQIGVESSRELPFGIVPTTTIFREYQKFGKLRLPSVMVQRLLALDQNIEQVITLTSYEFDTVPASTFDLPPVIKALIK